MCVAVSIDNNSSICTVSCVCGLRGATMFPAYSTQFRMLTANCCGALAYYCCRRRHHAMPTFSTSLWYFAALACLSRLDRAAADRQIDGAPRSASSARVKWKLNNQIRIVFLVLKYPVHHHRDADRPFQRFSQIGTDTSILDTIYSGVVLL